VGGGESRALAAEEGRDVSNLLTSANANVQFAQTGAWKDLSLDLNFTNTQNIKNGDYAIIDVKNIYLNGDIRNQYGDVVAKAEVIEGGDYVHYLRKYADDKNPAFFNSVEPGWFWGKVKITFTNIASQPNINLQYREQHTYTNMTPVPNDTTMKVSIHANNREIFAGQSRLPKGEFLPQLTNFDPWGSAYVWTGREDDHNRIKPYTWNIFQWQLPTMKKGTRFKISLTSDKAAKLMKIPMGEGFDSTFSIYNDNHFSASRYKLNNNNVYIPKKATPLKYPARLIKSTNQELEFEYTGDDINDYNSYSIGGAIGVLKDIAIPLIRSNNLPNIPTRITVTDPVNGTIVDKDYTLPVYLQNINTNSNALSIDPRMWQYIEPDLIELPLDTAT